jgi:hypothetical protein
MMTVEQLVLKFGYDKCSIDVQNMWDEGDFDEDIEVVHVIEPNPEPDPTRLDGPGKLWRSSWYEKGRKGQARIEGFLADDLGYDEQPFVAPRWSVTGEDVYGNSPAMDGLGDIQMLQKMESKYLKALEKGVDPPTQSSGALRKNRVSIMPGFHNMVKPDASGKRIETVHEVNPGFFRNFKDDIARVETRIAKTFLSDLVLMFAPITNSNMTAREVEERSQEKSLQLGPVLERVEVELLAKWIDRTMAIMARRDLIPEPPQDIAGDNLKVEYVSKLAHAQKMIQSVGIERVVSFVLGMAGETGDKDVLDKLDMDQIVDKFSEAYGIDPSMIRSDDEVEDRRMIRTQSQVPDPMAAAGALNQGAQAASTLADTTIDSESALAALLGPNQQGGQALGAVI